MSAEAISEDFIKGPAYALVIGISDYQFGKNPGEALEANEFAKLKRAAKDAQDFADFLSDNGMIPYNVVSLIDKQATLSNIKSELDALADKCSQSESEDRKPMVVVFFSGHGMVDPRKRHFLLPYDADGSKLFGTALWHRDFQTYLDELSTDRRVVFLDACHSGVGREPDTKGGEQLYSPLAELGQGEGLYTIASCGGGQFSYEGKENGIFTEHLLRLLKCEQPDAIPKESIDIMDLYPVLKERVSAAAQRKQVPTFNAKGESTGIVLAINRQFRDARIRKAQDAAVEQARIDKETTEAKKRFLEDVCGQLAINATPQKRVISRLLRTYVESGVKIGYLEVFQLFEDLFVVFLADSLVGYYSELLVDEYLRASRQPKSSNESRSQSPSKGNDAFVPVMQQTSPLSLVKPAASISSPAAQPEPTARRQLTPADQQYVLAEVDTLIDFGPESILLRNLLGKPLTAEEFSQQLDIIKRKDDPRTGTLTEEVSRRFQEKWANAEVVQTQTVSNLIGVLRG